MRTIRAWGGCVAAALTLAPACSKPHEPRIQVIAGCNDVLEVVEVEGRLYGRTAVHDPDATVEACAFDVDPQGLRSRVDRYEGPGHFDAMLVEPDGSQILATSMPVDRLFIKLFRRDASGMSELDELRVNWLNRSLYSPASLLPTTLGPALVVSTWTDPDRAGSGLRVWRLLDPASEPPELTLPKNARLFHDADTIVSIAAVGPDHEPRRMRPKIGSSFTVSVLDELGVGDEAVRWTGHVTTPGDTGRGSYVTDVAVNDEQVFVLASEVDTEFHWLACLAVGDGEPVWTSPIDLGGFEPQLTSVRAGIRAKDEGVVVGVYGFSDAARVAAIEVSPVGEQSIISARKIVVPWVGVVEPGASGRIWLAGVHDGNDAWVTSVELPRGVIER